MDECRCRIFHITAGNLKVIWYVRKKGDPLLLPPTGFRNYRDVTTITHKRLGNAECPVPSALYHHVTALVSDFAAEYGEVDLVSRRVECSFDEYEGLLDAFDSFGVVGGAGVRVVREGNVLLAQYEHIDGWIDPGDGRRPGESYADCAKRGVRRATGVEATIDGLAQIQLVYLDDPTDRPPAPNPYISFSGSLVSDDIAAGEPITALQWADEPPDEVAYEELSELSLAR